VALPPQGPSLSLEKTLYSSKYFVIDELASMLTAFTYHASDGAAYEHFLGRWTKVLAPHFLDFAELPPDGPLLDVGTGTGSLAFAMAQRWPTRRILGVDVAEPYIAYAQSLAAGPSPAFEIGDACTLPFQDGTFCGAAAQLVLNFVPNAAAAVGEMKRVTKRGGTIAAAVWDFRGGLVFQRILWDTAAGIDPQAGIARDRLFSSALALPDALPRLFSAAGLGDVQRGSITIRMNFLNFDDYWQPLLGGQGPFGSYVATLSFDMRRRIEDAVRRAYCSGAPDGERSLTATAWAVRGRVQ
jgi:SAM-dependent methyltransferase